MSAIQTSQPNTALMGLSQYDAKARLQQEGPNELSKGKQQSFFLLVLGILKEPMFLLLLASGGIYALLGDIQEALMLLVMIILVISITLYQEFKTERTLQALRDLSSPRARVIREGQISHIPGTEVVREDIVLIGEGDRIPADGTLVSDSGLSVDESLLTGESVPVRKEAEDNFSLYAGTLAVQGQGTMRVDSIGMHTKMGAIGKSLETLTADTTALQKETQRWVRLFGIWGLILCTIVIVAFGVLRQQWMEGFLAGITLAMSLLPEEFPMVLTVFLALGAWRIAKKNVLTRRAHAIEALGTTTILCVDKTGTLTLNKMSVSRIVNAQGKIHQIDAANKTTLSQLASFWEVLETGRLASQPEGIDPMDKAILSMLSEVKNDSKPPDQTLIRIYPLTKSRMAMIGVWESPRDTTYALAAKGAPEAIFDLCHLEEEQRASLISLLQSLTGEGLRVLGVAAGSYEKQTLPEEPTEFSFEFKGLLAYEDPLRPTVPQSIIDCRQAGIRVMMLTGDYPDTAISIAKQIGLEKPEACLTGEQLSSLSDDQLLSTVQDVSVFARMVPDQKLRLVNALKSQGQIVAMTGDGVNDAPALKASHIGIAMGQRGTDVAREAADLVLLDDDFSSIVQAIGLGRRIFDNLRKAFTYIFAIHVPIAGMTLLPVLMGWPLMLFPAHIAFLEMVIDPTCSLAFEAEPSDKDVMKRTPRNISESLVTRSSIFTSLIQGNIIFLSVLAVYIFALTQKDAATARTMGFISLVAGNLSLIASNLAGNQSIMKLPFLKNKAFWIVLSASITVLSIVLSVPALRKLFQFSSLEMSEYLICVLSSLASLILMETGKRWMNKQV